MLKRLLFSLFTGMLFGVLLASAPEAQAQEGPCFGYCKEQILRNGCVSYFAGCELRYDENGLFDGFTCFYVNTCVTKPNNT